MRSPGAYKAGPGVGPGFRLRNGLSSLDRHGRKRPKEAAGKDQTGCASVAWANCLATNDQIIRDASGPLGSLYGWPGAPPLQA